MGTKKATKRERGLELSRGKAKKKRLVMISAVIVVAVALVSILSYTMLANDGPAIISLAAVPNEVLPSGDCQITCHATDPDGDDDELTYDWSASGGEITGEGLTVNWTAPDSPGSYKVTVTVTDPRGAEVMSHVNISVGSPPTIASLVAATDWIAPSGSVQLTCTASDPDGDELSYEWSASGGNITGTGAVVNWIAPAEVGMYDITVLVTDSQGREDTLSIYLSAATGNPLIIGDLIVTAEHKYLKETSTGYKVGKMKEYDIECIASNTSGELVYEWSCDLGEMSGEGSMINWTAPDVSGEATVSVVVTDAADNRVTESIILDVVSCSACLFG